MNNTGQQGPVNEGPSWYKRLLENKKRWFFDISAICIIIIYLMTQRLSKLAEYLYNNNFEMAVEESEKSQGSRRVS